MIELSGKRVLVVGLGTSGAEAARVASGRGAVVRVVDSSASPAMAQSSDELRGLGVKVDLGLEVPDDIGSYDLLVASPGVPDSAAVLTAARGAGVRVISELELGYRLLPGVEIIAVTGTNGKTTTTRIIGEMVGRERRSFTCGNIGNPVVGLVGEARSGDVLVVEVSSFQLQNIEEFRPRVGVVLNVAPDHYDWHSGFDEYLAAKARLVENMRDGDSLVYNADDVSCRMIAGKARCARIGFAEVKGPEASVWRENGWITAGKPLPPGGVMPLSEIKLAGEHNVSNVMAAAAASMALGISPEAVRRAAAGFEGLEHRMEFVAEVGGVAFYNDSKATNPHAALHAVRSFEGPMVAIMGGRNKGLEFDELAAEICEGIRDGRVRGLVLVGESAGEIRSAVERACASRANGYLHVESGIDDSVGRAFELSGGEGIVLFTPACASFDMFDDYKDRGRAFKESVMDFKGSGKDAGGE